MQEQVDKVSIWLKDTLPGVKLSKAQIEAHLLRGPMKDVMLKFLVPRFHSQDKIDVLRSNFYIQGVAAEPPPDPAPTKNDRLTAELAEWERTRSELEQLVEAEAVKASEVDISATTGLAATKRKIQQLQEMINFAEGLTNSLTPLLETPNSVIVERENHTRKLDELQDAAIELFRATFFEGRVEQKPELNSKLELLCDHIVRGKGDVNNLSEKELLVWQKSEINKAQLTLEKLKKEALPSTAEDLKIGLKAIKRDLTTQHLDLFEENIKLEDKLKEVYANRKAEQQKIMLELQRDPELKNINLSLLLKLVEEQKMKANQRFQTKERSKFTSESSISEVDKSCVNDDGGTEEAPNETMKKLLCSLLKTFPNTCENLKSGATTNGQAYSNFIEALNTDPERVQGPDLDRNEKFEEFLLALNPNSDTVSSSFALQYSTDIPSSRSDFDYPLEELVNSMSISDPVGRAHLQAMGQLITRGTAPSNGSIK